MYGNVKEIKGKHGGGREKVKAKSENNKAGKYGGKRR